jgi:hypothetical protein
MSQMPWRTIIAPGATAYLAPVDKRRETMKAMMRVALAALSVASIGVAHVSKGNGVVEMKRSRLA